MSEDKETFEEWCLSYDDFEMFVGINKINQREASNLAWNHQQKKIDEQKSFRRFDVTTIKIQQAKIDELEKENEQLKQELSVLQLILNNYDSVNLENLNAIKQLRDINALLEEMIVKIDKSAWLSMYRKEVQAV